MQKTYSPEACFWSFLTLGDSRSLDRSAIILAGGFSNRLGEDKGLTVLAKKPLIKHVLDATKNLTDEVIVVTSSKDQATRYADVLGSIAQALIDSESIQSPLIGALTGLGVARGKYSVLLSCDIPFVSRDILSLLFDLCPGRSATIPRWPTGFIEPLQAVYCTGLAFDAARNAFSMGKLDLRAMIGGLKGVRYVSTLVLKQLDPELRSFFNVNSVLDLRKAESMLESSSRR
jgi:molybdopterin-guanine dinucleotide biosynthesis protein A